MINQELIKMAKPIRATPTLSGKSAERFLLKMLETQNRKHLTKVEKEIVRMITEQTS